MIELSKIEIYSCLGIFSFLILPIIMMSILNKKIRKVGIGITLLSILIFGFLISKNIMIIKSFLNLFNNLLKITFNFMIPAFFIGIILIILTMKIENKILNILIYILGAFSLQFSLQYFLFRILTLFNLKILMTTITTGKEDIYYAIGNLLIGIFMSMFMIPSVFYKKRINMLMLGIGLGFITMEITMLMINK